MSFWHSSAHIMAEALESLYPGIKLGIGPAIDNGFYYDVDFGDETISEKDFIKIEAKFLEFSRNDFKFKMKSISKKEALEFYKNEKNEYKIEFKKKKSTGRDIRHSWEWGDIGTEN